MDHQITNLLMSEVDPHSRRSHLRAKKDRYPVTRPVAGGTPQSTESETSVRPFLKWVGGKRQLLPQLRPFVPPTFERYIEPFVGSGAMFFDLYARGVADSHPAILGDTNADLIGTYAAIADHVEAVIRALQQLAIGHVEGGQNHYYDVRDNRFNPQRRKRDIQRTDGPVSYPATLAAMFLYLNRTGFNGLYRLNARGDFNVPAGRYTNPRICDTANLRAVSSALRSRGVELHHGTVESTVAQCASGDFVYLDPPYAPLSTTANFTSYTAERFSEFDQRRLQEIVIDLVQRGCFVVLSNSTAPLITALYGKNSSASRAGLRTYRFPARRAINSDPAGRGTVEEYVITNVRGR